MNTKPFVLKFVHKLCVITSFLLALSRQETLIGYDNPNNVLIEVIHNIGYKMCALMCARRSFDCQEIIYDRNQLLCRLFSSTWNSRTAQENHIYRPGPEFIKVCLVILDSF